MATTPTTNPRPISTRFPAELLRRIDADVAQNPDCSDRTAWIVDACRRKLSSPMIAAVRTAVAEPDVIDHANPPATRTIEVRFRPAGARWRWWTDDPETAGVSNFKRDIRDDAGWKLAEALGRGARFTLKLIRDEAS